VVEEAPLIAADVEVAAPVVVEAKPEPVANRNPSRLPRWNRRRSSSPTRPKS
jgi:hypothetical protein